MAFAFKIIGLCFINKLQKIVGNIRCFLFKKSLLRIGCCPKSFKTTFASLHFAKVLIARRATTFGKVDYSDNQLLFGYIVGVFCKTPT